LSDIGTLGEYVAERPNKGFEPARRRAVVSHTTANGLKLTVAVVAGAPFSVVRYCSGNTAVTALF